MHICAYYFWHNLPFIISVNFDLADFCASVMAVAVSLLDSPVSTMMLVLFSNVVFDPDGMSSSLLVVCVDYLPSSSLFILPLSTFVPLSLSIKSSLRGCTRPILGSLGSLGSLVL